MLGAFFFFFLSEPVDSKFAVCLHLSYLGKRLVIQTVLNIYFS